MKRKEIDFDWLSEDILKAYHAKKVDVIEMSDNDTEEIIRNAIQKIRQANLDAMLIQKIKISNYKTYLASTLIWRWMMTGQSSLSEDRMVVVKRLYLKPSVGLCTGWK